MLIIIRKKAIEIYESDEAIDDEYTKVFSNTMEKNELRQNYK